MLRIIATSMLCLCLLTMPALPAFGKQNQQGQRDDQGQNHNGQQGHNDDQGENGPRQTSVPEPGTTRLLALGLGGVAAFAWWRRHHAA